MMRKIAILFFLLSHLVKAQDALKPIKVLNSQCNEPSDILFLNQRFWVLGDKAFLYEMTENAKVKSTPISDFDLEGLATDGKYLYVSEETYQRIWVWDPQSGEVVKQIPFKHNGGRNEGVESLTYVAKEKSFYLATEKDPNIFYRTDEQFAIQEQFHIPGISEVSGMACYQGFSFVLSDEASTLFQVDFQNKKIIRQWKLPIINPEGVTFDDKGNLWICADDMQKIYQFNNPLP
jgi:uncharacterized protein YjiK